MSGCAASGATRYPAGEVWTLAAAMPTRSRVTCRPMAWVNAVLYFYAALNIVGGILGFVKAQSVASIVSGVVIGILLFVSVAVARGNERVGYSLAGVVTFLTLGFFVSRWMSKGLTPVAVVMVVASLAVLACLVAGHVLNRTA